MIKAGLKPYASIKGPVQQQLVKLQVGVGLLQSADPGVAVAAAQLMLSSSSSCSSAYEVHA
jgi:hypothetical protein